MIITCPNCNKKFNLDDSLIAKDGRLLKCSKCENTWFFKPDLTSTINIKNEEVESEIIINNDLSENVVDKNISKSKEKPKKTSQKVKKDMFKKFLNNMLIILITFIAVILVVDTFKFSISSFLPGIIPLLDNLYETLFDLTLFIKDLFN